MTFLINRTKIALTIAVLVALSACTKVWDDHDKVTDPNLKNNLYQAISQTANLSKFSAMMAKTGYDKIVSASKTYTVWAPTDAALQSLDPTVLNDTAKLKLFVGNHISNQTYLAGTGIGSQRIQVLNGKYINTTGTTFDSANIITANQYANNGVFHIIDKFIPRYDNCWQFLQNTSAVPMMKTMLLSLNYIFFDSTKATQIGVDPNTGRPIWDSANGKILRNHFLDNSMNVNDETGQYTFVLIADAGYSTEISKITPYFKTGTTDSTNNLAGYHLIKDFAFAGVYTPAQLPITLLSTYGVHVPLNASNIIASYKTSNGIVYIMSDISFQFADKFPPIVIQGEKPVAFAADRTPDIFYRIRKDSLGNIFNDIYALNYNYASYWIQYIAHGVYSTKYNISWVALNDVQTTPLWQQKLSIDSVANTANLPYVTVPYDVFAEIPLGQWTLPAYRDVPLFVIGPTTASSTGGANSISLDYIKLTPLP